ncbi:ferredoxin-type protein NapF [uncultured Cohaesibacter sp.]|uniref:ferredoxin-type protein NapF n=1 Tax=uncultured Cohaesibacter sp. TaxID=1002546 RepID=UPI0029C8612B|nr:ferredoxin-type protein NapF [uncultured Cohaesibacter sp.]
MTVELNRRNFLRGKLKQSDAPRMYPPGAQPNFERLCSQCGECSSACPEAIIIRHETGLPVVDFTRGGCTFCNACTDVCETGALLPAPSEDWPWQAEIGSSCFSLNGIACRACEDACEPRAISFRLMTGGRSSPILDTDQCTGCGECSATCPASAITFATIKEKAA